LVGNLLGVTRGGGVTQVDDYGVALVRNVCSPPMPAIPLPSEVGNLYRPSGFSKAVSPLGDAADPQTARLRNYSCQSLCGKSGHARRTQKYSQTLAVSR